MYKPILTFILLAVLCISSFGQTLILKKGKDVSMKFRSSDNNIIASEKGINTDEPEIYLMVGFAQKTSPKKKVTFSIIGTKGCNLYYVNQLRETGKFSDMISRNLEIIKIEFLKEEVNGSISLEVNDGEKLNIPLKYKSKNARIATVPPVVSEKEETKTVVQDAKGKETGINSNNNHSAMNPLPTPPDQDILWYILIGIASLLLSAFSFWRGTKWKREIRKEETDTTDEEKKNKEAIQSNLLAYLLGDQQPTENYSFKIQDKIKNLKTRSQDQSIQTTEKLSLLQNDYDTLNNQYKQLEINNTQLKTDIIYSNTELEKASNLVKSVDYNKYYLSFNDGLLAIFQDLEKAKENLNSDSFFNELFDKILKYDDKAPYHPLLNFSNRDNHIVKSLKLESRNQLQSLTEDEFFNKFVLWHCGNLINNLSKLYAYAQFKDKNLNLSNALKEDGIKVEHIESAFIKLSKLIEENFNKSIQVPQIGKPVSNPEAVEEVDYCFIKAKYFDKIPHLDPGIVYDFNKVIILNKTNADVVQKGQVSVKV